MSEKNKNLVHKIYSIAITVALIAISLLFILNAVGLFSGNGEIMTAEKPLSGLEIRELIGQKLMDMIVPIIIVVFLIILGIFLDIFIPNEKTENKVIRDPYRVLNIMLRKHKESYYKKEDAAAIHKERKFRLYFTIGGIALFLVSIIYPLIVAFSDDAVSSFGNANQEVLTIMLVTLIFLIPSAVYAFVIGIFFNKSRLSEYEIIKRGVKEEDKGDGYITLTDYTFSSFLSRFISCDLSYILKISFAGLIITLSILFIILGIINGGMADVLNKAVNICRECIGLG